MSTVAPSSRSKMSRVELFRLLSESDRLRVLALCGEEELSVGELSTLLDDSQPQVSRKVAPLRDAGLLLARKEGTRAWLSTSADADDVVLRDALEEGRRLCQTDGTLAKLPAIVAAREEGSKAFFEQPAAGAAPLAGDFAAPAHLAHLAAFAPLLPGRSLAIDAGTGEGLLLDVLAPLYARVIAVDRSQAQLARCAARVAERGFHHVSLFPGSYDDVALVERVDIAGGADLVFSARALHHVARPSQAVAAFARLLKRGGHLVLLEYQPHEDDSMRGAQGDVWLGFTAKELSAHCEAAGLQVVGEVSIPSAYHREGPDAHLAWHSVVARKPTKEKSV